MLRTFVLRFLINAMSLWAAIGLLSGVSLETDSNRILVFLGATLVFTIVNGLIRPVVVILALPAVLITFGLFMFVINACMLYLVALVYKPLEISSFPEALFAALVIWAVNYLLTDIAQWRKTKS